MMALSSVIEPCEQSVASSTSVSFLIRVTLGLKIHLFVRCDAKNHGINLAIRVSGIVHAEFVLFASMNGEDCLLSVVVTCSSLM